MKQTQNTGGFTAMPLQPDGTAPYAPSTTVTNIVSRYRERGLAAPFTADVLMRAGVAESLLPRTLHTLKLLELIDETGNPTPALVALGRAKSDEYQGMLAEVVRSVYKPVFDFVDPATDPPERITDAFRGFSPRGQQGRMVSLFMSLCEAAGIVTPETPRPSAKRAATPKGVRTPQQRLGAVQARAEAARGRARSVGGGDQLPPALSGLLAQLPETEKGWNQAQRDRFYATFGSVLDFCIPIVEEEATE